MIPQLYVITDTRIAKGRSHEEIARKAVEGGADVIQLRDKHAGSRKVLDAAVTIRSITLDQGVTFIVNDRLDIALACGADGVHLGQDDLPVRVARRIVPPGFIIGASVGTVSEAITAVAEGADYVALSPTFDTGSKGDAGPGRGLGVLKTIRAVVNVPVFAIGGISLSNIDAVLDAGADGVAVISAVAGQADITAAARELKNRIRENSRSFTEKSR